jgi:hypothetical protein
MTPKLSADPDFSLATRRAMVPYKPEATDCQERRSLSLWDVTILYCNPIVEGRFEWFIVTVTLAHLYIDNNVM